MQVLMESRIERDAAAPRVDKLARRIHSRYPILRDGAIMGDGAGGVTHHGPALREALRAVAIACGRAVPGAAAQWRPERLRQALRRTDARPFAIAAAAPQLVLLDVTPRLLWAGWRFPDGMAEGLRSHVQRAPGAAVVLRFYDITDTAGENLAPGHTFDIEVERPETGMRYVDLWAPDRRYVADLGVREADGRFTPLARSNKARVCRETPADGSSARMRTHTPVPTARIAVPASYRSDAGPVIVAPGDADWPLRDLAAERNVRNAYLGFLRDGPRALREAEAPSPRPRQTLESEFAVRRARRDSLVRAAAEPRPESAARASAPEFLVARLDTAVAVSESAAARTPLLFPPAVRPDGLVARGADRAARALYDAVRLRGLPRKALAAPTVAAETKSGERLPARLRQTLEGAGRGTLELEAELVLRGRVRPGRKVRVGGRVIEPAPDGTFVVSCVVKNGRLHVPVEEVEAEVVVERRAVSAEIWTPVPQA